MDWPCQLWPFRNAAVQPYANHPCRRHSPGAYRGGGAARHFARHSAGHHPQGRIVIKLIDVTKTYPMKSGGELRALDHVSLHVEQGEWLAIMGPSGSGKSTLVNLLGCLDAPTAGKLILDGQDLADVPASQRNRIRAEKIGFVFQQFHLIPYLTAVENVMLAQYFHSMTDEHEALAALDRVGLRERARHLPSQLSGGEQQRVCVARALIN